MSILLWWNVHFISALYKYTYHIIIIMKCNLQLDMIEWGAEMKSCNSLVIPTSGSYNGLSFNNSENLPVHNTLQDFISDSTLFLT